MQSESYHVFHSLSFHKQQEHQAKQKRENTLKKHLFPRLSDQKKENGMQKSILCVSCDMRPEASFLQSFEDNKHILLRLLAMQKEDKGNPPRKK